MTLTITDVFVTAIITSIIVLVMIIIALKLFKNDLQSKQTPSHKAQEIMDKMSDIRYELSVLALEDSTVEEYIDAESKLFKVLSTINK